MSRRIAMRSIKVNTATHEEIFDGDMGLLGRNCSGVALQLFYGVVFSCSITRRPDANDFHVGVPVRLARRLLHRRFEKRPNGSKCRFRLRNNGHRRSCFHHSWPSLNEYFSSAVFTFYTITSSTRCYALYLDLLIAPFLRRCHCAKLHT